MIKNLIFNIFLSGILAILGNSVFAVPTQGAYVTDKTQTFSNNFTQETMDQVNNILCVLNQTNYSDFTNLSVYLAQVDFSACGMGGEQSNSPTIAQIITESSVISEIQTVKFWITGVDIGSSGQGLIQAKLVISASPTTTNPYGQFVLNYIGYPLNSSGVADTTNPVFQGYISTSLNSETGQVALNYYDDYGSSETVQLSFVETGDDVGHGVLQSQLGGNSMTANIAFNDTYLQNLINNPALSSSELAVCYNRSVYLNLRPL